MNFEETVTHILTHQHEATREQVSNAILSALAEDNKNALEIDFTFARMEEEGCCEVDYTMNLDYSFGEFNEDTLCVVFTYALEADEDTMKVRASTW